MFADDGEELLYLFSLRRQDTDAPGVALRFLPAASRKLILPEGLLVVALLEES